MSRAAAGVGNISRMVNAFVSIERHPRTEALAILSRPVRRIARRQSIDIAVLNRQQQPQQLNIPPRRMSVSEMPAVNPARQAATRAQVLQQLGMPGLLQLDESDQDDEMDEVSL